MAVEGGEIKISRIKLCIQRMLLEFSKMVSGSLGVIAVKWTDCEKLVDAQRRLNIDGAGVYAKIIIIIAIAETGNQVVAPVII